MNEAPCYLFMLGVSLSCLTACSIGHVKGGLRLTKASRLLVLAPAFLPRTCTVKEHVHRIRKFASSIDCLAPVTCLPTMARLGFLGLRRALGVRSCASEARIIAEQVGPSSEKQRLKVVVAVGGNALIRRGERLTIENQLKAARNDAAPMLKKLMADHSVVLTHGNLCV